MYRIRWNRAAIRALQTIAAYLKEERGVPWVADKVIANIERTIDDYIAFMPRMFTQLSGSTAHACCLPYPYIIYYDIDEALHSVTILDIIHGAQGERRR